ncbi:cache domain-containing sensor histidine kinase [Paenibacillus sp. strain BS8-2]
MLRLRYRNLPLRYKLVLWFSPLFLFTIGSIGAYSYNVASEQIFERQTIEQNHIVSTTVTDLDYIAQDAIDTSNFLYLRTEIQQLFRAKEEIDYDASKLAFGMISSAMITRQFFQSLILYSNYLEPIEFDKRGNTSALPMEEFKRTIIYKRAFAQPDIPTWAIDTGQLHVFQGESNNTIIFARVLKSDLNLRPLGIIVIGFDELDLRRSYASPVVNGREVIIVNPDGEVLSDSQGKWLGRQWSTLPYAQENNQSKLLITESVSNLTGWRVIALQSRDQLLSEVNRINTVTLYAMAVMFLVALAFSWIIASFISKPLKNIVLSMQKFQKGDFMQSVTPRGHDELGLLGYGYNNMVKKTKQLIDEVYTFRLEQREAELKLLQSQINPHFLYNTLNTMAWKMEQRHEHESSEMVYALSSMFQISLSDGKDMITLQEEFVFITSYLFLQKMRAPRLHYEISLDETLRNVTLLKLIVQPFVENAVIHGIEPLGGEGLVQVSASVHGDVCIIKVTDNGVGIPADRLAELKSIERTSIKDRSGFALWNVQERLRLYYGQAATIDIESEVDFGTRISITIPLEGSVANV